MKQKLKELEFKRDLNNVYSMLTLIALVLMCFGWFDGKVLILLLILKLNITSQDAYRRHKADATKIREILGAKREDDNIEI